MDQLVLLNRLAALPLQRADRRRTEPSHPRGRAAARRGLILGLTLLTAVVNLAAIGQTPFQPEASAVTSQIQSLAEANLGHALFCLVGAAVLGSVLAFRPRREGGPPRVAHVTQAQIMMSIVGALVMLIVGASLARAFAIAGTAGLVRYRAKIDDPKDASVMLSCLAVGLACGVGLIYLAGFGTAFIVAVLWILEWREPWPAKPFELEVSAKDPSALKAEVEALLKRHKIGFELRELTEKHITYSAEVPHGKKTDRISEAITALQGAENVDVVWSAKKVK